MNNLEYSILMHDHMNKNPILVITDIIKYIIVNYNIKKIIIKLLLTTLDLQVI